jgi:CHRD domain
MRFRSPRLATAAAITGILTALALAGPVLAAETVLTADLAGAADGDPDGSGTATITIDPAAGTACWELTAEGINPVTQSHIHVGAEGVSGDVVVPLDTDGFEGSSEGCIEPMEDAAALQAIVDDPAGYYVNLHTDDFQGGAIRGQLAAQPPNTAMAPASAPWLMTLGLVLLLAALATAGRAFARRT